MWLTRMYLNPRRRGTVKLLSSQQAMHAAVMSGFPPDSDAGRVLWRLETAKDELKLLMLSKAKPSLEHLQEQAGWAESGWESRDFAPLLSRLAAGQRYAFRLVANPTFTRTEDGKKHRVAHVTFLQQLMWLAARADTLGVRFLTATGELADPSAVKRVPGTGMFAEPEDLALLPSIEVSSRNVQRFSRRDPSEGGKGRSRLTIASAQFDGSLEVVDPDKLSAALVYGVGHAKAYGCGLLTLAPLNC